MCFRLVLLLCLLNYSSAQDSNCDFYQSIQAGDVRYIYSPNYPNSYNRGVTCRWIVDCPVGFKCRLDCSEIRLPQTPSCSGDRLLVSKSGDAQLNGVDPYCGTGSLSAVLSTNQRLGIGLMSSWNSSGGRFQCTVRAQAVTPTTPKCRCGERRQNRIVGGQETGVNEYTMVAGVVDLRITVIKCGAVIISDSYLVTAGHCVKGQLPTNYAIIVGEHDVTTGDSPATKGYAITKFVVHPSYSPSNFDYDIALVLVAKRIEFSDLVQPVCLPFNFGNRDFAGVKVTLVGWGTTEVGGPASNVPLKVDLDVLPQSTCRARGAPVTDRQLCTFAPGKDACQDDSGGPVLWTDPNTGAVHTIGIISYGQFCATETPGISTRMTSFLDWIKSVTGNNANFCIK